MTKTVSIETLAAALCCHPRTISRILTGATNQSSKPTDAVSLAHAATALKTTEIALSQFLARWEKKKDDAIDFELAGLLLGLSERQVRRKAKEGSLPAIAHFGHTVRFSREVILQYSKAR